ncbi:MAG TPA: D-alanyl-D-alanine carboxypeptidase/D-alanyl-D-alanine-endopeptidase [Pyrinomonadaceae bacterium]|nr:D-alanyl-D-alanine carboxypeptidase/D-alanyl-D-alanine-endopeptidase [Pyrinomonadaceae bacterium]
MKLAKGVKTIAIIGFVLLSVAFNYGVLVSAQNNNRDRFISQQSSYVVEIKSQVDGANIEVSIDGNKSTKQSISNTRSLLLSVQKKLKLKYDKKLIGNFKIFVNGNETDLQNKNEVEFDENKLKQFPPKPVSTPTPVITPTPTATPILTPTPTPIPTPQTIQTLPELQSKIRLSLSRPELRRGTVGIKIVSLQTGKVIYEENAEKYLMPASNMKSYTMSTAMERLTPNFRIVTSVYAGAMPDTSGVVKGDLTIFGRGDVSMAFAFRPNASPNAVLSNADYLKVLEPLADKIVQAGVKRIEGNLVGDESYFNSDALPGTWEWDDLQWYYGAEISALPILDNAVDLSVKATSLNAPCAVQILPMNSLFTIVNHCVTSASGNKRDLQVVKKLDRNILEISGTMPVGDRGYSGSVAISRPSQLFIEMLRQLLQQKGVIITGQNRVVNAKEKALMSVASTAAPIEITKLESPPFSVIAAKTMKPSQNMYTETILRILGEQFGDKTDPKSTSDTRGLGVVKNFLAQAGIAPDSVIQHDGSGLSRHDLITAASNVQLYSYMARSPNAQAWRDSLTIGGVDGTLRSRFAGTAAANNVRGKTGTIDQVSALTGYVTTAAGEQIVFSIIVNGVNTGSTRTATMDEIVVALANFNGKVN